MWESLGNDSCDTCEFTRKQALQSSASSGDGFFKDNLSPSKTEDFSLFEGAASVPTVSCGTDSSPHCPTRRSLEDIDAFSQDSGYGTGFQADNGRFLSYTSPSRGLSASFGSSSICSMEDDFLEDFSEIEPLEKASTLPKHFSKLISDPLVGRVQVMEPSSPKDTAIRPLFRRALSLQNPPSSGKSSRVRTSLFIDEDKENKASTKRPEPPTELENTGVKRTKLFGEFSTPLEPNHLAPKKTLFRRQFSATEESIKCAVQRSSADPDLIGDFTKTYSLPLTSGKHQDLKSITPETLVRLMKGEFQDTVESYKVIDCRYPYEFKGGHIAGAENLYTKEQIGELLLQTRNASGPGTKRQILVFHCEFSSQRGPNLYRYLRKEDRTINITDYPLLHYPEIYLLEGGYKNFFQQYAEMCVPVAYKEMLHPDHEEDLRHFRQKSKTWNADTHTRQRPSKTFKRL